MKFLKIITVTNLDTGFDIEVEDILGLNLREARNAFKFIICRQIQIFNGNITNTANLLVWSVRTP